jgi:hypothetical protein
MGSNTNSILSEVAGSMVERFRHIRKLWNTRDLKSLRCGGSWPKRSFFVPMKILQLQYLSSFGIQKQIKLSSVNILVSLRLSTCWESSRELLCGNFWNIAENHVVTIASSEMILYFHSYKCRTLLFDLSKVALSPTTSGPILVNEPPTSRLRRKRPVTESALVASRMEHIIRRV